MKGYLASNFTVRHLAIAMLSRRLQHVVYTSRNGLTLGLKRKGGLGFLPSRLADTEEVRFLRKLELSGKIVYDLGGFQGLMTIFFAKTADRVFTYEANPENVIRIHENAKLNKFYNVLVRNVAVSDHDGILKLCFAPLMPGAATGDPEIFEDMVKLGRDVKQFSVAMTSLDADIGRLNLPLPDFLKIDIEGMELSALQGMSHVLENKRPELYLELHGTTAEDKRANAVAVISFLVERGYDIYSIEQKQTITYERPTGRESHIYCRHVSKLCNQEL
jgi:FkbM family methyltransferase